MDRRCRRKLGHSRKRRLTASEAALPDLTDDGSDAEDDSPEISFELDTSASSSHRSRKQRSWYEREKRSPLDSDLDFRTSSLGAVSKSDVLARAERVLPAKSVGGNFTRCSRDGKPVKLDPRMGTVCVTDAVAEWDDVEGFEASREMFLIDGRSDTSRHVIVNFRKELPFIPFVKQLTSPSEEKRIRYFNFILEEALSQRR
jgi:hypothetical protein